MDSNQNISLQPPSDPSVENVPNSPTPESGGDKGYSDEELLSRFSDENTKHYAFNLLVRQYQQRLYWHVRRILLDHDDTNDVIQNVFIKVWNNLGNFRGESKLFTWLYRIASNEALSFLKQKKRRAFFSFSDAENDMATALNHDPLFTGDKIEKKLQEAILKLPPQQRLVFNMKYYDRMKYEEIAEILGLTTGGLKANYHHAVQKISKYITGG